MSSQPRETNLEEACKNGDLKKVQRLTEGRMLDSEDFHQAVQKAISHNHTHIVCYFLKRGMSAHHLWPAAYENAHASQGVFEQYIANGMDVKTDKNSPIAPPLAWVLDKPTIIKLFLTHGADPNASIRRASNTIFVQACASTPLSVIQLLVEYGAEASPLALRAASVNQNRRDQMEIVRYILAQGVDINDIPTGECLWPRLGQGTALWHVAREGTAEAIKVLLELGADASIRSSTGTTPLEIARQFQKQDIVTILAHAGVAPATDPENLQQSTQVENEHAAPEKVRPKIHVHVAQSPSGSS